MGNRHGLITGATGTGKTISLQVLADHFSQLGVPVFSSPTSKATFQASPHPGRRRRSSRNGSPRRVSPSLPGARTRSRSGTSLARAACPVRATISDIGPLLLGRLFNLNATQQGVLFSIVFKVADDNGLLLLDLKDLRAMLQYIGDNAKEFTNFLRQRVPPRRSAPSSASLLDQSNSRAARSSSANRCSTSTTSSQDQLPRVEAS